MTMKRCFELPVSPSLSLLGRAVLVGSVLSFATACARKDAAKGDSAVAVTDSAATTSAMTATPSSPVESVSTGETTVSAESKANPAVAATNVASGTANTAAKPESAATTTAPAHRAVHHRDSSTTKRATTTSAQTQTSTARAASADTGQKTAADTSKKTAAAGGAVDHLLVSPQEYEGWKMFSVYCYRCHGVDAMGGGIAPNLRHSVSSEGSVTHDVFITTVTNGRLDKGMPTWKALLSPEQMEDLWLYVNARSSNRLYPGRPHMAQGANP
jgi:mono/diheme cytochrome c family protein